jgi:hypothetical protein
MATAAHPESMTRGSSSRRGAAFAEDFGLKSAFIALAGLLAALPALRSFLRGEAAAEPGSARKTMQHRGQACRSRLTRNARNVRACFAPYDLLAWAEDDVLAHESCIRRIVTGVRLPTPGHRLLRPTHDAATPLHRGIASLFFST